MPDKEGSDDEKTTKGVVNKKQKQMLNQEYIPETQQKKVMSSGQGLTNYQSIAQRQAAQKDVETDARQRVRSTTTTTGAGGKFKSMEVSDGGSVGKFQSNIINKLSPMAGAKLKMDAGGLVPDLGKFAQDFGKGNNITDDEVLQINQEVPGTDAYRLKTMAMIVNKNTKREEYIPEEEYDHYRDRILMRGGDHRSKETRERSNTPSSDSKRKGDTPMQKEFKKKYGKKATALDAVKADITAKYGKGAIMDVGKKKVKEELDLTKIAEAFGGYIIEANGKKNGKKKDDIEDFIKADDVFNVKAKEQAKKDIEKEPETMDIDTFQGRQKFKEPVSGTPKAKGFKPKPGSVKFTQRPGEAPIKRYIDPSKIDPKIAAREKAKRKEAKKRPTAAELAKDRDEKLGAKSFKKDIGGEKIISPTMQDRLKKATAGPKRSRKRRSDAASYAQVKADIDTADAARRAKKIGEYSKDYEKRLAKAYDKSLEDTVKTGRAPAGQPLPQAPTSAPKGEPQKGQANQSDAAQEFNRQQNILRRLQRQGMADSGATPFKQPPLPEVDPSKRPKSDIPFSQFQNNQRLARNKKDEADAAAYRQTPEYALQTGQVDPDTKEILSKDELKRRFRQNISQRENDPNVKAVKKYREGRRKPIRSADIYPSGGFESARQGTLTRRGTKPESPNVETMPQQIGRKMTSMIDKTQTGQQSMMGALGGFLTKGVSSSAAGAEAGVRYARGDKFGAALSALQGMGGSVGFAAGVANAIKSMRIARGVPDQKIFGRKPQDFDKKFFDTDKKNRQLTKAVPPEELGMAAAAGGAIIPQVKGVFDRVKGAVKKGANVRGGKVGRRSAPS